MDPLLAAIRRELGAIIAKLHRMDFSDSADRMGTGGGPSPYMKDLVEKMSFIRTEVLVQYNVPERIREW